MAAATRTPLQHLNDYLVSQCECVRQSGSNKRWRCTKCNHNFSGSVSRIHEHLKGKPGDVKGCTYSVTNDKKEVCDEIDALVYAVPKSKKHKAADVSQAETASCSGPKQMPIQQSLQAAGKVGVDQALAHWVFEAGIPFNVFR